MGFIEFAEGKCSELLWLKLLLPRNIQDGVTGVFCIGKSSGYALFTDAQNKIQLLIQSLQPRCKPLTHLRNPLFTPSLRYFRAQSAIYTA